MSRRNTPLGLPLAALLLPLQAACGPPAWLVGPATYEGMMPILSQGIDGFVAEPDPVLAETALTGNLKLIEAVSAAYPDEAQPATMAAMARANYAFGFVQDELEAVRIAYPDNATVADSLLARALENYRAGQAHAERALAAESDEWAEAFGATPLAQIQPDAFAAVLAELEQEHAEPLFWLAFNWGGRLQAKMDPADATQLPKIEAMAKRVLELDETVFYGIGPHLLMGTLRGFRSPALGGSPDEAKKHFEAAERLGGGVKLPAVMLAQFVYAQTEAQEDFEKGLEAVLAAPLTPGRALLDALAKRKACRLLAQLDNFFLADPRALPAACRAVTARHPRRAPEW